MLKEQNRLLTKVSGEQKLPSAPLLYWGWGGQPATLLTQLCPQEVTDKGHRITQLEQEKSALIKQLFGARAQSSQDTSQLDSTFI